MIEDIKLLLVVGSLNLGFTIALVLIKLYETATGKK